MLNKKVVISFILSLLLVLVFSLSCSAVEMGMSQEKVFNELDSKFDKTMKAIEYLENEILISYKDGYIRNDHYFFKKDKLYLITKYYSNIHKSMMPKISKVYGSPTDDYYCTPEGKNKQPASKIDSLSQKERSKLVLQRGSNALERRTVWQTKNEYIILHTIADDVTYILRLSKAYFSKIPSSLIDELPKASFPSL